MENEQLREILRTQIRKLDFVTEVVRDWSASEPGPEDWPRDTIGKAFAGFAQILDEIRESLEPLINNVKAV